ncbi:MAG: hypothetical protein K0S38_866 [Candidatus Paceibacter sp.]|jgi:hypothetical protein|nr:hypothetical protein [Candidatus Paceibacter sp.]
MKKYKSLIIVGVIVVILATMTLGYKTYKYHHYDTYLDTIPQNFTWKHYRDDIQKYELDYPDYTEPTKEYDLDTYGTLFGQEFSIESSSQAPQFKTLDDVKKDFSFGNNFFDRTIIIDGHEALVFKYRYDDGTVLGSYYVYFLAEGRFYSISIHHPVHDQQILKSFKVLK